MKTPEVEQGSMTTLLPEDVRWCVRLLGPKVAETVKKNNLIVAGGFIRSAIAREEVNDLDMFPIGEFVVEDVVNKVCMDLHGWSTHRKAPIVTDNAVTILCNSKPVQIVYRWRFNSAEECVKSFDYTIARAAIWWDGTEWKSVCDDRFYADLSAKRLVYRAPERHEDAGGSMLRMFKFYQRGYRAPLDTITLVSYRWISGIDRSVNDPEFMRFMLARLVEVDPNADPTHDGHF